jgi:hypothetical protein
MDEMVDGKSEFAAFQMVLHDESEIHCFKGRILLCLKSETVSSYRFGLKLIDLMAFLCCFSMVCKLVLLA